MRKFNLEKEKIYGRLAIAHAQKTERGGKDREPLLTIKLGMPEWAAWQKYFHQHMGFEPLAMTRAETGLGSGEMTVPEQWPQEFNGSYLPQMASLTSSNVKRISDFT